MPVKGKEGGGSVVTQNHPVMGWRRTARSIGEKVG